MQCESNRSISHVSVTAGVPFTHTIAGMSNASNLGAFFNKKFIPLLLR